jgi:folylpolyglutamate synthase/dihydropteroate synthase
MCDALFPAAKAVCLVPVASARTAIPEELRVVCGARHPDRSINVCHSLAEAFRLTQDEPFRLIAGSLYLVGEALELLGVSASPPQTERGLNEWTGKK